MKRIALFVDVDNTALTTEQFQMLLNEVNESGSIVYGKIYGAVDRKHKEIIDIITNFGYDMAPPVRIKKRGSKIFDTRIFLDVMEMVCANNNIDAVTIVSCPTDLVPLFSKLREYGISIMSLNNLDKESSYFVDEFLQCGDKENDFDEEEATISEFIDSFSSQNENKPNLFDDDDKMEEFNSKQELNDAKISGIKKDSDEENSIEIDDTLSVNDEFSTIEEVDINNNKQKLENIEEIKETIKDNEINNQVDLDKQAKSDKNIVENKQAEVGVQMDEIEDRDTFELLQNVQRVLAEFKSKDKGKDNYKDNDNKDNDNDENDNEKY
ncbi:MAG: NYN domain-containing protein [Clostridia bacterium]